MHYSLLPKIMGKATTALAEGLMRKIGGVGGIDFGFIGKILIFVMLLYVVSSLFTFIQGFIMTTVTQRICYRLRKDISEKINRMPMKYFESKTHGEVLSRITNDVDTMGMGLNQSITTIITSFATLIGVLVMVVAVQYFIRPVLNETSELKKQTEILLSDMGLNMTTAVNIFLRQVLRTGSIPFEITTRTDDFYNPVNQQRLHKSIERLEKGLGTAHELIEVDE